MVVHPRGDYAHFDEDLQSAGLDNRIEHFRDGQAILESFER